LIEAFRRRFIPKPVSGDKDKGLVRDVAQETTRAINPRAELEKKWNQKLVKAGEPKEVYQTPAKPKTLINSLGEPLNMTPEDPYPDDQ
jgi:hypothetical protein